MQKPHACRRFAAPILVAALLAVVASAATADTIYLKNGRVIRSSIVRVEGDRVVFVQYGGEVSLPMSVVDRIEEDAAVEPVNTPPPAVPVADPSADPAAGPSADPADVEPEQTRDYWQERVQANAAERVEVNLQIEDLRRTERAFLFSQRSTADTRAQIATAEERLKELDTELTDLRTEARRLGVPNGWLRVAPGGGEAGSGGSATTSS